MGFFGGGKGGGGVDPYAVAQAQAEYNRGDIATPFGGLLREGQHGRDARITLSPDQQLVVDQLLQFSTQIPQNVQWALQTPYQPDQYTGQDAANAMFQAATSRINPEFDMRQKRLQDQLTQQGMPAVGADLAPGAVSELDVLNRARNDALLHANLQAQMRGEESALQHAQRRIAERNQPLAEIGASQALLGNAASAFGGGPLLGQGLTPIDVTGAFNAATQSQLADAQLQAGKNKMIAQLGSAAIGAM